MLRTVLIAAAALGCAAELAERQDIFTPSARYPCFRQPVIVTADDKRSVVLAFAENRNVSACAPALDDEGMLRTRHPDEIGSLQLRRSLDAGKTWLPMQSIFTGSIDFYTVTRDAQRDTMWLMLQNGKTVQVLTSKDAGASWELRGGLFEKWDVKLPAGFTARASVGHGIQLDKAGCAGGACEASGKLLVPFICTNTSMHGGASDRGCEKCNSCLLASGDGGKTWGVEAVAQSGTRESQLVQVQSTASAASLYSNARAMGAQTGHRLDARSSDGGSSYDPASFRIDPELTEPVTPHWTGICAGLERVSDFSAATSAAAKDTLVFSAPADAALRANMTVRVSPDGGHSWGAPHVVWAGPAGYSDLARVGTSSSVVMVFENGDKTFADRVSVQVIDLADMKH